MSVAHPPTVRQIIKPSETELDACVHVLCEAFGRQFFAFGLGGDKTLQDPIHRAHVMAALVSDEGEVHTAELPDVGVVGVAVWFKPGYKFLATEAQRDAGWNQLMDKLEPRLQDWWKQFLSEYDDMVDKAIGADVKLGGWHLQLIGVLPTYQGRGIGTKLMKHAEDKARSERVPSVLETASQEGVELYRAMGYVLAGSGPIHMSGDQTFDMYSLIKHTEANDQA